MGRQAPALRDWLAGLLPAEPGDMLPLLATVDDPECPDGNVQTLSLVCLGGTPI